ncbi:MAG: glycosyltransferase [Bacteroidales bacterium]|jgi:cellulose synthase/poly-beta-1,6-N-acetylglucosamine synthase-like glycosyltransferase|nr:glycosyltransferase [Bacteroidales bacterium]
MGFIEIFVGILALLLLGYGFIIISFTWGLYKLDDLSPVENFTTSHHHSFTTSVSVIIPVRNESRNITRILDEMRRQDYPDNLVEVIVTDDFSVDDTCKVAEHFIRQFQSFPLKLIDSKCIHAGETGKKKAIERAINMAKGDLILCTDADTCRESHWISSMVTCFENGNAKIILGPVVFQNENNLLQKIQSVEFIGLMGVTAGSASLGYPVMCNGANLAYPSIAFRDSGGFEGNKQFVSGDDQFLLAGIKNKFGRNSVRFQYDRSAIVRTDPAKTLTGFINQRLRWVSKGRGYRDPYIIAVAIITYLTHFFLLSGMISGFWWPEMFFVSFFLWLGKILLDYPMVLIMTRFFGKSKILGYYFIAQVFQLLYVVTIGPIGLIFPFTWKGRKRKY